MTHNANDVDRSSNERYGDMAIALHWTSAILVVAVGGLGLLFRFLDKQLFIRALSFHAAFGLLLLCLIGVRIFWRLRHAPPKVDDHIGRLTQSVSWATHITLYALLVITPMLGIAGFLAHGRAFDFGFVRFAGFFSPVRAAYHPAEQIHRWLAYALFGLSSLHIMAAFFHHVVLRDRTLNRMSPRRLS